MPVNPQNKPGEIKRLNFETLGGDDHSRLERTRKGLQRDVTTPRYSIPKSIEGTRIFELIDRNEPVAAVEARNEIAGSLANFTPVIAVKKIHLSYIDNYMAIRQLAETEYQGDAEPVEPETYQ